MESTVLFWQSEQQTELPKWKSWDLTALTQKWLNTPTSNYGVILWATNEDVTGYTMRFHSSEASNSSDRPYLEVVYSTEATTSTVYFLKDHLGSIRATVLDSAGAPVIGYDDYDPWGYPLALRTKPIPNAYLQGASKNKFTGMEYDDDFGWDVFWVRRRPYIPAIGRWAVLDPSAAKSPDQSPYNYAFNNPLKYVDPNGKFPILIIGAALAGALIADAIFADPANAPSPQDVSQGNVQQGKSDAQFAVEQGIGAGLGALGGKLIDKAIGAIAGRFTDEAVGAATKLTAKELNAPSAIKGLTKADLQRINVAGEVKLGKITADQANKSLSEGGSAIASQLKMGEAKRMLVEKLGNGKYRIIVEDVSRGNVVNRFVTTGTAKELGIKNLDELHEQGVANHFVGKSKE